MRGLPKLSTRLGVLVSSLLGKIRSSFPQPEVIGSDRLLQNLKQTKDRSHNVKAPNARHCASTPSTARHSQLRKILSSNVIETPAPQDRHFSEF